MELYISENIKRLRREKGITQETLAERMHISAAAVSKWERGETMPDITMILPLASYFGVSADEILGLDAAKNEEKIKEYLKEIGHLRANGRSEEQFDLVVKAYGDFPNDWRIVEEYMWQLNYDPHHPEPPYGNEVHKEELYRLCGRVLDECAVDETRYAALSILGGLYLIDGQTDKAIETAKRFPDYYMTCGEELEHCFDPDEDEAQAAAWGKQIRENLYDMTDMMVVKIRNMAISGNDLSPKEQIAILDKVVRLIALVYDEGDYGFSNYHLSELYLWMANRYVMTEEYGTAFAYYDKGLSFAKAYDELPTVTVHTSFLVRGKELDMTKTSSGTEWNLVARALDDIRGWGVYKAVKDMPEMEAILAKYEPFRGKKNYG